MKVLLNAYPRSGSTTFTQELRGGFRPLRKGNPHELAEFDEWIIYKHEPFIYMGNYGDDVTMVAIVRNPIDAISSNVERWFKGFTGNVIQGVQIVDKQQNIIDNLVDLGTVEKDFIDHQIEIYTSYLSCLEKNIENIKCFLYEQTRTQTDICIANVMIFSGIKPGEIDSRKLTKTIINTTDRHPIYFKVREYLESKNGLLDQYTRVYEHILNSQNNYPIPFK